MSQVTISFDGRSTTVSREVADRQLAKAEQAIEQIRAAMAARHSDASLSSSDQAAADKVANSDIARYEGIAAACRAALNA